MHRKKNWNLSLRPLTYIFENLLYQQDMAFFTRFFFWLVLLSAMLFIVRHDNSSFGNLKQAQEKEFLQSEYDKRDELFIPSMGIRAPVFKASSWNDGEVGELLKSGIALLPTETWLEGDHRVVTAHSSGTISMGDKRFLFATIHRLRPDEKIILYQNGKTYVYRVLEKKIVTPTDIGALPKGEKSTLTLVSCWPIGSDAKRILVIAEKITEDTGDD